jgi:hypothetical protein
MIRRTLSLAFALSLNAGIALAQNYDIDPNANPGKARFIALAQAQFNQDHSTLFKTIKPAPGDEQAVFECGIKALLADMPDADAGQAADMIEGKSEPTPAVMKWFALSKTENPERRQQVMGRAHEICPQFREIMK